MIAAAIIVRFYIVVQDGKRVRVQSCAVAEPTFISSIRTL